MVDYRICNLLNILIDESVLLFGKKFSVSDFARELDLSRSVISEAIRKQREPSKAVIKRIIEVFGVNILDEKYLQLIPNEKDLFFHENDQVIKLLRIDIESSKKSKVEKKIELTIEEYRTAINENHFLKIENQSLKEKIQKLESDYSDLKFEHEWLKKNSTINKNAFDGPKDDKPF